MFTTSEIPAKLLIGRKTVIVTNFRPLNNKITPIKCIKFDENFCVIFITLSRNEVWERNIQEFLIMHDHKHH